MTVTVVISEVPVLETDVFEDGGSYSTTDKGALTVYKGELPQRTQLATYSAGTWQKVYVGEAPKRTVTEPEGGPIDLAVESPFPDVY